MYQFKLCRKRRICSDDLLLPTIKNDTHRAHRDGEEKEHVEYLITQDMVDSYRQCLSHLSSHLGNC